VLALDTSTARFPRARDPRPEPGGTGGWGSAAGPIPLVVILFLEVRDAQVVLEVFLLELFQGPVVLHLAEDLVHATN
jgi:hypothetical protein